MQRITGSKRLRLKESYIKNPKFQGTYKRVDIYFMGKSYIINLNQVLRHIYFFQKE